MLADNGQSILIREKDGRLKVFEAGKWEKRIRSGFAAADQPDEYLAEDIAFALEYTLLQAADNGGSRIFQCSEVESFLSDILTDSGLGAVGRALPGAEDNSEDELPGIDVAGSMMPELFRVHFNINADEAARLAGTVRAAMQKINIPVAPPELLTAFAGYYRDRMQKTLAAENFSARSFYRIRGRGAEFILQENTLTPCRKLRISMAGAAAEEGWDLPLTELTSAGVLIDFGKRIKEIKGMERKDLPLAVIVSEAASTSEELLGAPWPEGKRILRDLLENIWFGLGERPVRIMFKSGN